VRGASYYALDNPDYYKQANAETAVILQIEGTEGIANLDEILEVPDVDAIFIGPFDLSQSLGIPGQVTDVRVIDALKDIIKRAEQKGIAVGNFAVTPEQADNYIQHGIRFLAYSTDTAMLTTVYLDLRKSIKTK
jgi:4-hydroxy-2-oxoheptanedioate aldolase